MLVVAEMSVDGILGLDFLNKHDSVVDIAKRKLIIGSYEVPMFSEGSIGCCRVSVSETCSIPPRTEMIVYGDVHMPYRENIPTGYGLIEPDENFAKSDCDLIAKTLHSNAKRVPLRIMNVSTYVKVVISGTIVAFVSPVEEVVNSEESTTHFTNKTLSPTLSELLNKTSKRLTGKQKNQAKEFLIQHAILFANDDKELGKTGVIKHKIRTGDRVPMKKPFRRMPVSMREEVDKHIDDMLERDVIVPSVSPWAAGVVLAKKKDGTTRLCVDYRQLNDATLKDAYPLPRIDESLDHLSGAQWFSTLDLCSGYWKVELEPEDKAKIAFVTKRGLFQFNVMPFGLCNAPATFERLMETVLSGLQWDICLIYLDDIIVVAKTYEEMLKNLQVFERLSSAELKLKAKKCHLFSEKVDFLGHVVSSGGIATDPKKINTVRKLGGAI